MNPFINIMNTLMEYLVGWINSISPSMVGTIKRGYYFLLFILAIIAVMIGSRLGERAAKIEGEMIIKSTNEAFRYTVKDERKRGTYHGLVDSETIPEPELFEHERRRFGIKEPHRPESAPGTGIIEGDPYLKKRETPEPDKREKLIEGSYGPLTPGEPSVRPISRRPDPDWKKADADTAGSSEHRINPADQQKPESPLRRSGNGRPSPAPVDKESGVLID